MKHSEAKKGVRVMVPAAATGDETDHFGTIEAVTVSMGQIYVDVLYDKPDKKGRPGISMNNLDLIQKLAKGDKTNQY